MTSVAIAGSTGLVGSHILTTLLTHPAIATVHAFSRRALDTSSPKLRPIISTDTSTWAPAYPASTNLFITALGTTRAAAGSIAAQRAIDHDLNLALAKAAREHGATACVLVSSSGASPTASVPYSRMKGELEDAVAKLGFERVAILRPGLIVGDRGETRAVEGLFRGIAKVAGAVSKGVLKDFWAQDADVIARAAVAAGLLCLEGKAPAGVWIVDQKEILKLGKAGGGGE